VQTNVLIKKECILKNKNKLYPFKKLSVFYNSCLKSFGSHLVCDLFVLSSKYTLCREKRLNLDLVRPISSHEHFDPDLVKAASQNLTLCLALPSTCSSKQHRLRYQAVY
jgi:hypothetical protein